MRYLFGVFMMLTCLNACKAQPKPTVFSEQALNDYFISKEGKSIPFSNILEKHKGQTILIDVWASWCRDCIIGFPELKELQIKNEEVVFIYLSLDKSEEIWKRAIEKYQLNGEHYFMSSGWDGPFGEFLDLDWIPRYLIVDKSGSIKVFRAIKAKDTTLTDALKM